MSPRRSLSWFLVAGFTLTLLGSAAVFSGEPARNVPSVDEARARASLLHETIHDTLQVVHARYFREDEGLTIPAANFKRIFESIEERNGVKVRWLVVDGRTMNVNHEPRDAFEKEAAEALSSGKDQYERFADGVYRYAGPITLGADCLKCHLPSRSSNQSRTAGLLISMPAEK